MKSQSSLTPYILALLISPIIGAYNLYSNLTNNIYPVDHDIIAIPIFSITATSIASLLLLLFQQPYRSRKKTRASNNLATTSTCILCTAFTATLFLAHIIYWTDSNHLPTLAIFLMILGLYAADQKQLYGRLPPK